MEKGGDGIDLFRNLRLVRCKVASRKELSHRPGMSSIRAASTMHRDTTKRCGQRAGVQPLTHRPAPLKCIVTPLSGK